MVIEYFINLAGFHHLILDQKGVVLKQELLLEPVMNKMQMNSFTYQRIMTGNHQQQKIQRFIEWLKWRPTEVYKRFMKVLRKTDQAPLAEKLLNACKHK